MTTKNIFFIDSRVVDYQTLLASLPVDSQYFVLEASQDGIEQMQSVLAGYSDLDSIQIISHGSQASLYLGSAILNNENINLYSSQLAIIGNSLTSNGDILLYGCNVAEGERGRAFVDTLAKSTGADVAASTDLSGPIALNADIELEIIKGSIESQPLNLDSLEAVLALNTAPVFFSGSATEELYINSRCSIRSIVFKSDGTVWGAGSYYNQSSQTYDFFLYGGIKVSAELNFRYDENGFAIALQSNGKVIVAGITSRFSDNAVAVVQFGQNGSVDWSLKASFSPFSSLKYYEYATSVAVKTDGKIIVVGNSGEQYRNSDFGFLQITQSGLVEKAFTTNVGINDSDDFANDVVIQTNGNLLVAGCSNKFDGNLYDFALVRYTSDGSLDGSFSNDGRLTTRITDGNDVANKIVVQSDGKILVVGYSEVNGLSDLAAARYKSDGSLDSSFSNDGMLTLSIGAYRFIATDVIVQPDGKILVAGSSSGLLSLVRLNSDGTLDTSFRGGGILVTEYYTFDKSASVFYQSDLPPGSGPFLG